MLTYLNIPNPHQSFTISAALVLAHRMLEAISLPERHVVTYVPRSNIPRIVRQVGVCA
jgi:deoxycytidine triphosphate deaminase